jgi:hypothetical protein
MAWPEGNVANGVAPEFKARKVGVTPDDGGKQWTWYMVSRDNPESLLYDVLGMVAESPEVTPFDGAHPYRYYRVMMHERSRQEGQVSYTTAQSLEDAVDHLVARYEKLKDFDFS